MSAFLAAQFDELNKPTGLLILDILQDSSKLETSTPTNPYIHIFCADKPHMYIPESEYACKHVSVF